MYRDKEKERAMRKRNYNAEKKRIAWQKFYESHKQERAAKLREWRRVNPDKVQEHERVRYIRMKHKERSILNNLFGFSQKIEN